MQFSFLFFYVSDEKKIVANWLLKWKAKFFGAEQPDFISQLSGLETTPNKIFKVTYFGDGPPEIVKLFTPQWPLQPLWSQQPRWPQESLGSLLVKAFYH